MKFRSMLRASTAILAIIGLFSCENTWMKNLLAKDKGAGTASNPFMVYNEATLRHVGNPDSGIYSEWTLNAHYIQTQDIYMVGGDFPAIGNNSDKFTGSYDGNGKTISNLTINTTIGIDYQGLFGYIAGATIKNVRLENCGINTQGDYTGSVVGYNDGGLVQNCSATVTGVGSVYSGGNIGGGVVGINFGTVRNCYSEISVFSGGVAGGVVGSNGGSSAKVENCYSMGSVSGGNSIGGIVGNNGGTVQNCYAEGSVYGSGNNIGGVVGNIDGGTVKNCYFTGSVTGTGTNDNIGGVTGNNNSGTVQNCYATGSAAGGSTNKNIGGIVGNNYGTVQNCVALNTSVIGFSSVGRVVGYGGITDLINNCARDNMPGSWPSNLNNGDDLIVTGGGTPNVTVFAASNGWSSSVWNIPTGILSTSSAENRALPTLKNMPGAAQNPQLPL